jgi:AcrR family transcriptional regulator
MTKQVRAEETHAQLLEAAAVCFGQKGYNAASVADICRQAGVSKGAFYHHFASKHELFLRLMHSWLTGIDEQLDKARLGADSVSDALMNMAEAAGFVFRMADRYINIFIEFYIQAGRNPVVWQAAVEPYRRYHDFFAQLFEAGVEEGSVKPVDPALASRVLASLALGLLLQVRINPDQQDWAQVAQEGVRMLLEGLQVEDTTHA